MAPGPVSVEQYLASDFAPSCEFADGSLTQKPLAGWDHAELQSWIAQLIRTRFAFRAGTELTVQIRPGRFLVPDVGVQAANAVQRPYPTDPIALCVEILSPSDRLSEILAKCEEYHRWGVPTCWIVDPETRRCWEFRAGRQLAEARDRLTAESIWLPVDEIFSILEP